MKKLTIIILLLLLIFSTSNVEVLAQEHSFDDVLETLIDSLDSDMLNVELNELWGEFDQEKTSFKDKIFSIINGDFSIEYKSVFSLLISTIFSGIKSLLPVMLIVCFIALLYSIVNALKPDFLSDGINKVLYFACYGAIVGLVIYKTFEISRECFDGIKSYSKQMEIVFPLLLTVMTATGANVSASVYQPAVAFLTSGISNLISTIIIPLIVFLLIFSSISGLSKTIKMDKTSVFLGSLIKWILGICVTVFTLFLSIQGMTAGAYDGITLRVTKYAIGNSVPIVGGFLKDGVDLFLAAGLLIKNSIGICGILLVAGMFLAPLCKLVAFSLFLKLTSGLIEPFADGKISDYLMALSKNLNYVLACVLLVCFMYLITIILIICTGGALL